MQQQATITKLTFQHIKITSNTIIGTLPFHMCLLGTLHQVEHSTTNKLDIVSTNVYFIKKRVYVCDLGAD